MPGTIEVRCGQQDCPYAQPGSGFQEDGTGSCSRGMSEHTRQTKHKADGLYVDGERVSTGNRATMLYLQNHGLLRQSDRQEPGPDGDEPIEDDREAGPADGWGRAPEGADDDPEDGGGGQGRQGTGEDGGEQRGQAARPVGRPPTPDLTRGYIVARDIPITDEVARLFSSHYANFPELYLEPAPVGAPDDYEPQAIGYNRGLGRWISDLAVHDLATRPERYPMARDVERMAFEQIANAQAAQDARWRELEAYRRDLDRRHRDLMDREAALPPAQAEPDAAGGGAGGRT